MLLLIKKKYRLNTRLIVSNYLLSNLNYSICLHNYMYSIRELINKMVTLFGVKFQSFSNDERFMNLKNIKLNYFIPALSFQIFMVCYLIGNMHIKVICHAFLTI